MIAKVPTITPTAIPALDPTERPLLGFAVDDEDVAVAEAADELASDDSIGSDDGPVTVALKQDTSVVKSLLSTKVYGWC